MWTQGLTESEKEEISIIVNLEKGSKFSNRLLTIIKNKRLSLEASERTSEIYNNNNWAFAQAHNNGARQMLMFVEKLLS